MEKNFENALKALKEGLELSLKDAERNCDNPTPDAPKEYWEGKSDGLKVGLTFVHLITQLHSPSKS